MFSVKLEGFEEALNVFNPSVVNRAAKTAVTEAARAAKTETSSLLRQKWNIKKRDLEKKFTVKGSTSGMERVLTIAGPPISLAYFKPKEIRSTSSGLLVKTRGKTGGLITRRQKRSKGSGLSVEIHKGQRTNIPNAWLAYVRSFAGKAKGGATLYGDSSTRVLARTGKNLFGPKSITVASMFEQEGISEKVLERADATLRARFFHHLDRLSK